MLHHNRETKREAVSVILKAGIIAGVLDGIAAIIINPDVSPAGIFRFIASGVLGESAFTGDSPTALFGVVLHLFIATSWAAIFFFIYPKIKILTYSYIVSGVVYGLLIWLIMNLIVVPVSATPPLPFRIEKAIVGVAVIMLCVGIPISAITGKYFKEQSEISE